MESVVVVIFISLQSSHIVSIKSAIEKVLLYDKKIVFPIKFAYQGNPTNVLCRCGDVNLERCKMKINPSNT